MYESSAYGFGSLNVPRSRSSLCAPGPAAPAANRHPVPHDRTVKTRAAQQQAPFSAVFLRRTGPDEAAVAAVRSGA
ncbi:hypothetical protein GCM10015535_30330 [Streptomyces gelaticus]|uniref:Uncharacterized protein n=1 Tax=Streptomyces gelaticus TaxID=285446 RepID=A0ABQ2W176_9ACTN|nr:hypothetical protein GCM10015535_30330 [Streptomyces gelaticus]